MFAIDPGPKKSAWVFLGDKKASARIVSNAEMLDVIESLIPNYIGKTWAIEMIASFGMPVGAEVFETVMWIGRFSQRAIDLGGLPPRLVYRKDVKMHLCHSMRAKDPHIRQALIDRFGAPGTKKAPGFLYGFSSDMWSALAVAVTAQDTANNGGV